MFFNRRKEESQSIAHENRSKFLRRMTNLTELLGRHCVLKLDGASTMVGVYQGFNKSGDEIILSDVEPPFDVPGRVIVRMSDIGIISFPNLDSVEMENPNQTTGSAKP